MTTVKTHEGKLDARGCKFALVASRFNEFFVSRLLEGAIDCLVRHGAAEEDMEIAWVPGSWELPLTAQRFAEQRRHDAVIALGAIIRGATPHFDYVAAEASKGLAQASLKTGVPVTFGVITTDTIEQAVERAGTKAGNKGADAAAAAIEMVNVLKSIDEANS
jgi:6,7-dimethyl-8-ribityllumazine synthase